MKRNIFWNTFGTVFYGFCTWLITIIVVHIGSFTDAGYLSIAMSTASTWSAVALFAMRNYQITDVEHEYTDSQYVSSRVISCIAAYVILVFAAFMSGSVYQALCIIAFMPVRLSEAYSDVFHGIDQMNDRYDLIGKSFVFRGLATLLIFIVGFRLSDNLLLTLLIIAIVDFAISVIWDYGKTSRITTIRLHLKDSQIFRLFLTCLPLMLYTLFFNLINNMARTILQQMKGTELQGIYSSISNPVLVVQVMATTVFAVFLPGLAHMLEEKDYGGFRKRLLQIFAAYAGLSALVILLARLLGKWVLALLLGDEILGHYEIFMPVIIVTLLNGFVSVMQAVLVALRRQWTLSIGMAAVFAVFMCIVHPGISHWGVNGTSYVQSIAYVIYIIFALIVTAISARKS